MTRNEYIYHLKQRLRRLPKEEIESAVEYVNECFDEAGEQNEQEVIERLGKPNKFAAQIIADTMVVQNEKRKDEGKHTVLKSIGLILLGMLALPIGLPAVLIALVIFFIVGVLIFLFVVGIIFLIFSSGVGIYSLLSSGLDMLNTSLANGLLFIGTAILAMGVCLLILSGLIALFKYGFPWIANRTGKIYQKLKGVNDDEEK